MKKLTTNEPLLVLDSTVGDFWAWAYSDILINRNRGIFAEFIVAQVLNLTEQCRTEWDSYDLFYKNCRIEIKSSAYLQAWEQAKESKISFSIAPKKQFNNTSKTYSDAKQRNSDVYVFCIYTETVSKDVLKVLDMNNWNFYVVETSILNKKFGEQESIGINPLQTVTTVCTIHELKSNIDVIVEKIR